MSGFLKELTPPVIFNAYNRFVFSYGFFGNYATWDDAKKACCGYDSGIILNRVKNALLKVKKGEAIYERDSVLFDKIQYSWPLLSGLLWIALQNDNRLSLIDFGGSMGSTYYQNRKFLNVVSNLRWSIVEQKEFVNCGKQYFEDEHLRFYYTINNCILEQSPDTILLSGVLQYLESPYKVLNDIISKRFKFIIFDRTSFIKNADDRLTIQKVPPHIYDSSYPAWFFSLNKFMKIFSKDYELIADFESIGSASFESLFRGFIFKLR